MTASSGVGGAWLHEFGQSCSVLCQGEVPASRGEWKRVYEKWLKGITQDQMESRLEECDKHESLVHCRPGMVVCGGL